MARYEDDRDDVYGSSVAQELKEKTPLKPINSPKPPLPPPPPKEDYGFKQIDQQPDLQVPGGNLSLGVSDFSKEIIGQIMDSGGFSIARDGKKVQIVWNSFKNGIITSYTAGKRPPDSLEDAENYLLNRTNGALELRHGYTQYIGGTITDISNTKTLSSIKDFGVLATETPSPIVVDVLAGDSSGDVYFQKPFFQNGQVNSWVNWKETHTTTIQTITGTNKFTLTLGSVNDGYYRFWIVNNVTRNQSIHITLYIGSTKEITVSDNLPNTWVGGDSITLYRYFHENKDFIPTWTNPVFLAQGDAILVCGGRSSDVGNKPIWSGYLNKTFFQGLSNILYNGTYVCEAEIKTSGVTLFSPSGYLTSDSLEETSKYFAALVFETDDGQLTSPIKLEGYNPAAGYGLQFSIDIFFAQLNKRMRYIHIFIGESTNISSTAVAWSTYRYVRTYDMLLNTVTPQGTIFAYQSTSGGTLGYHRALVQIGASDLVLQGADLVTFLGRSESAGTTCSFNNAVFINNILFVSGIYDYALGKYFDDSIRHSDFAGNGLPQINVLTDLEGVNQSTVESGDPSSIVGIARWESSLVIIKDDASYYVQITPDKDVWELEKIANFGSDIPKSIVSSPIGVFFAKSGDDIYLFNGGTPKSLTKNTIRKTFRAYSTTNKSEWIGWWDNYLKSFCMSISLTDKKTIWVMCAEMPAGTEFAWMKQRFAHGIDSVKSDYTGNIYFKSDNVIYKIDKTAITDAGIGIAPYLDSGEIIVSEKDVMLPDDWAMSTNSSSPSGTLKCEWIFDSGTTSITLTNSNTRFSSLLPLLMSRTVRFKFNTHSTKAMYGSHRVHEIICNGEIGIRGGDMEKSL